MREPKGHAEHELDWTRGTILSRLARQYSGEWGDDPGGGIGNARVLRATNLDDDGGLDLGGAASRVVRPEKLIEKALRPGDILLEASGGGPGKPVGRVALFEGPDDGRHIVSNFFRTLRPREGVHPSFLFWRLHYLHRQPAIWLFQQQTTGIINLKVKDYLSQEIDWPSFPEQCRIVGALQSAGDTIRGAQEKVRKMGLIEDGLVDDLLAGRVRVLTQGRK